MTLYCKLKVTDTHTLQCNVRNYACDQTRAHTMVESSIVHTGSLTSARLTNITAGEIPSIENGGLSSSHNTTAHCQERSDSLVV